MRWPAGPKSFQPEGGGYRRWRGTDGEEVWFHFNTAGISVGVTPFFTGSTSLRVAVIERIHKADDSPLDGAFYGWANPPEGIADAGDYPFAFDTPDFFTYEDLPIPGIVEAHITGFAHDSLVFDSIEAFHEAKARGKVSFSPQTFVPHNRFDSSEDHKDPPESMAYINGFVVDASLRTNCFSELDYYWVLVETFGGRFDIVVDQTRLPSLPKAGDILATYCWLCGRLIWVPDRELN